LGIAFITGINGQDGAYLARNLLGKGYRVIGGHRRSGSTDFAGLSYLGILEHPDLEIIEHDVTDLPATIRVLQKYRPNEIYNLASQSFIGSSFDQPNTTATVTAIGPVNLLEAIRAVDSSIKFFQAGSSEMFGDVRVDRQSEETIFLPRSPYGVSKVFAHWMTVNYRLTSGIFGASGILFNHESPIRGTEFVTRKITDGVARISLGSKEVISLGNLSASRDWGFAEEYVEGMWRTLQCDSPETFIFATGKTTTVRDFVRMSFEAVGTEIEFEGTEMTEIAKISSSGLVVARVENKFYRPNEPNSLCGDASKAKKFLGWEAKVSSAELASLMVESAVSHYKQG